VAPRSPKKGRAGRPTVDDLERRKAKVLAIAEDLFLARGYLGTTVAEVAKRARVSPRLIAAHFGDKAGLFMRIIEGWSERFAQHAPEQDFNKPLEAILYDAAQFAWETAYSQESVRMARLVVGEGDRFEAHTSEIARAASRNLMAPLEATFSTLSARGLISSADPVRACKFFLDLIVGYSPPQAAMGYWERVPDDAELRGKVRFFCYALAGDRAGAPAIQA
jgi:TetR/AcrR family transcriptional repressor of mexJK operon